MAIKIDRDLRAAIEELGLLDPTDQREHEHRAAPPLETLTGKRGGFLDNRKGNADVLLERVRTLLEERYELAGTVACAKWIYSAPAAPDVLEDLSGCDFVVTAIGD
ncbi:MAG TPA: hypothetical protein VHL09_05445 [Dehalococcoidia bacterium]|nr:hypothetical protein [Dehalococcoidia bacterium]